mmetsp:Transcript_73923/g.239246  ORF Transcript_73923/g.239246 Transcript_73923/m.239246 type:complete len:304 (-) Transcript_73923:336-1247(-)
MPAGRSPGTQAACWRTAGKKAAKGADFASWYLEGPKLDVPNILTRAASATKAASTPSTSTATSRAASQTSSELDASNSSRRQTKLTRAAQVRRCCWRPTSKCSEGTSPMLSELSCRWLGKKSASPGESVTEAPLGKACWVPSSRGSHVRWLARCQVLRPCVCSKNRGQGRIATDGSDEALSPLPVCCSQASAATCTPKQEESSEVRRPTGPGVHPTSSTTTAEPLKKASPARCEAEEPPSGSAAARAPALGSRKRNGAARASSSPGRGAPAVAQWARSASERSCRENLEAIHSAVRPSPPTPE